MLDVLIIGAGPAGLALAAALADQGLRVAVLAPGAPDTPWTNHYGIWAGELDALGLGGLLGHRWSNCVVYSGPQAQPLHRDYGLFDNARLQGHLLQRAEQGRVVWQRGYALHAVHHPTHSEVGTQEGQSLAARLVVDAGGHAPALLQRPAAARIAYQTAYGVVGRFSAPPVEPNQLVLMDYRGDHLTAAQRAEPPTFLYAMDLGGGRAFMEETSLAHTPGLPPEMLERRLQQRLAHSAIRIEQIERVEHCRFPMNLPLPDLHQPILGYGAAASMVHPATGYQVGAALHHAPAVAQALVHALDQGIGDPRGLARAGWAALWPAPRVQQHSLYLFGLEALLRLNLDQTQEFFTAFFRLPQPHWCGYLSATLSTPSLLATMLRLFGRAPMAVRLSLLRALGSGRHLHRALVGG